VTVGARPVVIVGLMGAGKTTVGRALAGVLGVPFVDNDELLEAREGRTAAQLAADEGPEALHRAEADVARDALDDPTPRVVALAASVADDRELVERLRDHDVVWLRAEPATLRRRTTSPSHRPRASVLGETLAEQAARRAEALALVASTVIDVDGRTPEALVAEIIGQRV
jgi:shikimate kinase